MHTPPESLQEHFGVDDAPEVEARYNIAPSQPVLTVRMAGHAREFTALRWGLIPSWSREAKATYSMINARAETVADKPAYRAAFRRRRCLIPADGFYEWKTSAQGKQPYHISMKDGGVFAFAGLWEHWARDGTIIESCSIIVTQANEAISPVHDRMPVIIPSSDYEHWLTPEDQAIDTLKGMLQPFPAAAMHVYPVSNRVNRPVNDDAQCILPVEP